MFKEMHSNKTKNEEIFQFLDNLRETGEENLVSSFKGKIKRSGFTDFVILYEGQHPVGFYYTKENTRKPSVVLQGLYVNKKQRGKGYGEKLMKHFFNLVQEKYPNKYVRISSEKKAVKFYEKIGIKFICSQKSGTKLAIFKIKDAIMDFSMDEFIEKETKAKLGGCYGE